MSCVLNKQGDGRGNALAIRICHALKHKSITPKCIYMYVHWHKGKRWVSQHGLALGRNELSASNSSCFCSWRINFSVCWLEKWTCMKSYFGHSGSQWELSINNGTEVWVLQSAISGIILILVKQTCIILRIQLPTGFLGQTEVISILSKLPILYLHNNSCNSNLYFHSNSLDHMKQVASMLRV